jgi:hypothetical protein
VTAPSLGPFPYLPSGLTGPPFFTVYDLAAKLQLDPDTVNPDTAALLGQLASDYVRNELKLQVDFVANETVILYGDNGEILFLPQRPVTAVTSVVLAGQALTPVVQNATSTMLMYEWRPEGVLRRVVYGGSFYAGELLFKWPFGVPVTVIYSHGWTTIPSQFKMVALELAAGAYTNPEMYDQGRIGWTEWETRASMVLDSRPELKHALDLYRRITF